MNRIAVRTFFLAGMLAFFLTACKALDQPPEIESQAPAQEMAAADQPDAISNPPKTGVSLQNEIDGADLTWIPAALYRMGSAETDALAEQDEFPQHPVTVDGFSIYTHEVTTQMYAVCVEAGSCMRPMEREAGPTASFGDPEFAAFPVVGVDWLMARDYCSWAGGRLPTEAEWELASRGPESQVYPWGEEDPSCDRVNMGGCSVPPSPRRVGYYLLGNSPAQVWDLSGNVWEWVHDWYAEDYYSRSTERNPIGPLAPQDPDHPLRVIRGGGYNSPPEAMRSAARTGITPYRAFSDVGFRCVVDKDLVLPADYFAGEERHERVPTDSVDGGDSADDPESEHYFAATGSEGRCPDGSGMITLPFRMDSSEPPVHVLARSGMSWWDEECEYLADTHVVLCTGPEPPDYLDPPPVFYIDLCMTTVEWAECIVDLPVLKPRGCDDPVMAIVRYGTDCVDIFGAETPIITIAPAGVPADFSSAAADGVPLSCSEAGPELFHCSGLPGSPGDSLNVVSTFSDGSTDAASVVFPACGDLGETPPWDLTRVGCLLHGSATPEYYAMIDTYLDVTFTSWYLGGVEEPLVCTEESVTGRWYCNFPIRDYYGRLKFCASWVGHPLEACKSFPESEFGDLLPPSCDVPVEITCSDYTTPTDCGRHSGACWWDKDGGGVCRPLP